MAVPVVNTTEETLMLPARSTLGVVSNDAAATPTVSLKVNAEMSDTNPKEPDGSDIDSIQLNPDLTMGEQAQLRELIRKYADCFAWSDTQLGYTDRVQHEIVLTEERPIAQPYRRIPPAALDEVRQHIEDLLQREVIQPSSSPWASPIVVVRKKRTNEIRLCVDYRQVNRATRKDSFPLPRID